MTPSDFDLLDAWKDGDRAAASELFRRHFADVYGFFRSKIEHVAEDLTQQTFLACVESRDNFRKMGSFRVYLFIVARNILFAHLRRKCNRVGTVDFELESIADLDPSPSGVLVFREQNKLLVHALRRLPIDLQITLELYYVQRLRGPQLADVLGVPLGTARSRVRRALALLQENTSRLGKSPQPLRSTVTDLRQWAEELRAGAVTPRD